MAVKFQVILLILIQVGVVAGCASEDASEDIVPDTDPHFAVPSGALGDNPIVQTIYTADPAPMVHDGRLYVYTSHDEDKSTSFTMKDWRLFSTKDMVNWTDHGSPLAYTDFSWASGDAWAGQCIHRNNKFYYYVPVKENMRQMAIGVAVADSPTGPFTDALGHPLVSVGKHDFDPTVFIDDDGQAWLYWGNNELWYVKLNPDMISYAGEPVEVPLTAESFGAAGDATTESTQFEEGPWFYKRNELYYMVYAAGGIPEHIGYSTSPGPTGPWAYRGVIMPTEGDSFTNHPGVIDYMGRSYFFYHNGALPGGNGYNRSIAAEQFEYNADGTFPQISMDSSPRQGIGSLNPYAQVEAETIAWASGIEVVDGDGGERYVTDIDNGDFIKVSGVHFAYGTKSVDFRIASDRDGGSIEIHLDSETGVTAGACAFSGTGGQEQWKTKSCDISNVTGIHTVYFVFKGAQGQLFNFDWWRFKR